MNFKYFSTPAPGFENSAGNMSTTATYINVPAANPNINACVTLSLSSDKLCESIYVF